MPIFIFNGKLSSKLSCLSQEVGTGNVFTVYNEGTQIAIMVCKNRDVCDG